MTIRQQGGIFGRNPTFNNVTVDGTLTVDQIVEKTPAGGITLDGVTLKDGNVVLADGKGIDFSATSGTGTSELFDDYEEGTWTPTLTTDATNFTSVTYDGLTSGVYTKIGNVVQISGTIRTDAITAGSASGTVLIGGLPFTAAAPTAVAVGTSSNWNVNHPNAGEVRASTTALALLYRALANGAATSIAPADCRTTGDSNLLRFSAVYRT
jgi:hypothetical protein